MTAASLTIARAEEYTDTLDRQSRVLYMCLAVSLLLHAVLLSIHFKLPEALRKLRSRGIEHTS